VETIGPVSRRSATGPVRRLIWVREVPRPALRGRWGGYAVPVRLLVLAGLGLAAGAYLEDNRKLPTLVVVLLGIGSVLPVERWA
jgi:hypothetical protein